MSAAHHMSAVATPARVLGALAAAVALGACGEHVPEPATAPARATSYPIEILGLPDDETVAVQVVVELSSDVTTAAGAALDLHVFNVVDRDAFFVTVNDSAAIDLGDDAYAFRRGFGGSASGTIALGPASLHPGRNTITFSYERQVPDTSGFRVLDVTLYAGDRVVHVDLPWQSPGGAVAELDPAAIERGRAYFQDTSRDGGPPCGQCHADSGADLKYFGFSDESIVKRAMLHEFSIDDATEIAGYVRSLDVPVLGRPFDPPFQPGPTSAGAAGAGLAGILDDSSGDVRLHFAALAPTTTLAWDWAHEVDTFRLASPTQLPSWNRWLPRAIDPIWADRPGFVAAYQSFRADPTVESAEQLRAAAFALGIELHVEGKPAQRVDLLRFVAVKLWDWSRVHTEGFDAPEHGQPSRLLAYPYEVGFAFFEAAKAGALPDAWEQTLQWWWTQLATNPGRGASDGLRPINWPDLLAAAEHAGADENVIAFLQVYGSWEEVRSASPDALNEQIVHLLPIALRNTGPAVQEVLFRRVLVAEAEFLAGGGVPSALHLGLLGESWQETCHIMSDEGRARLLAVAPPQIQTAFEEC